MWELDCEESWAPKNWCFWTVVLEKTLESPLDWKEIQPVHPKGEQSWVFIGRTDAEAETPVLWPPHALTHWKRPWCWGGFGAGGEGDDRGFDGWMASPAWWTWVWVNSGSWWWTGRPGVLRFMVTESDTTEQLNWTELNWTDGMLVNYCQLFVPLLIPSYRKTWSNPICPFHTAGRKPRACKLFQKRKHTRKCLRSRHEKGRHQFKKIKLQNFKMFH